MGAQIAIRIPHFIGRMTLTAKTVVSVVLVSCLTFPPFAVYSVTAYRGSITSSFVDKAVAISRLLDSHIRNASEFGDRERLWDSLQKTLWLNPDVLWIDVNERRADTITTSISSNIAHVGRVASADNLRVLQADEIVHETITGETGKLLRLISPIHLGKQTVGTFELWLTLETVEAQIEKATFSAVLGYVVLVATFCGMLYIGLRLAVLRPIHELIGQVRRIEAGDLNAKASVAGSDEMSSLASSLNSMTDTIKTRDSELAVRNDALEGMNLELRATGKKLEKALAAAEKAEVALRKSEEQLRLIVNSLPLVVAYLDTDMRYVMINKTGTDWYKRPASAIIGKHPEDIFGPQQEIWHSKVEEALRGNAVAYEYPMSFPDGVTRDLQVMYLPSFGANGEVSGILSLVEDITERNESKAQLVQAQKMEAIGQLTAGVAHDFNNLLTVIRGNTELLAEKVGNDDAMLRATLRAAKSGAVLIQRLLAYSRQQPLQPRPTDLAELAGNMTDLLKRSLAETIDIEVVATDDLAAAMVDPGQAEIALLNLAINARDAMKQGGKLTIECRNVYLDETYAARNPEAKSGHYVVLAMSDNGTGMSAATKAHAFEPFFTTKGVGEGSGLGLSMVYGFASQSGGHVTIDSEEGRGTTVTLYLVRAEKACQPAKARHYTDNLQDRRESSLALQDEDNAAP